MFYINFQMRMYSAEPAAEHTPPVDGERQESCEEPDDVQQLNCQETAASSLIPLNMFNRVQSWRGVISSSQIEL